MGRNIEGYTFKAGDIFIDTNGDAQYGTGTPGSSTHNGPLNNRFGYEYVLDLDFSTMKYNVLMLGDAAWTSTVWYTDPTNAFSNPWRYASTIRTLSATAAPHRD